MSDWEAVIGLETHIQLNTRSKIFCGCKADSWGDPPNRNICPVCTGLPGVLPVLNRAAVEKAVRLAAAVGAETIADQSYFARKNYFYPDLPKGYQISQYDEPLARGGAFELPLPDGSRRIRIWKLHLEEDAGKTVHQRDERLIDFNRCGVPLVEMVTAPDLRSADEAAQYLIRLRQLLRWIGVSDADMERGQLRCDANVSLRQAGSLELNPKTEIKNVNSIENVRQAIEAEIGRQARQLDAGGRIEAWTLEWDEAAGQLRKMRSKETEADYRYFREPDLLPISLEAAWKQSILSGLPELPLERRARFIEEFGLPPYDAEILTEDRALSEFFEQTVAVYPGEPKTVSNWMMNDVLRLLRDRDVSAADLRMTPADLATIIGMVEQGAITTNTGKDLLTRVEGTGQRPDQIVAAEGLGAVSDENALREIVRAVIEESPEQVDTYRSGKVTILGWFVGQVMRRSGGKAEPQTTRALVEEMLARSGSGER